MKQKENERTQKHKQQRILKLKQRFAQTHTATETKTERRRERKRILGFVGINPIKRSTMRIMFAFLFKSIDINLTCVCVCGVCVSHTINMILKIFDFLMLNLFRLAEISYAQPSSIRLKRKYQKRLINLHINRDRERVTHNYQEK